MLENFFCAPKTLRRLRTGPSGPYIDGFAAELSRAGYSGLTAVRYLREAAYLGHFVHRARTDLAAVGASTVEALLTTSPVAVVPYRTATQRATTTTSERSSFKGIYLSSASVATAKSPLTVSTSHPS
ncbi:hypothetical protein [Cupriavidus necator]|uniref:hypothetical protein n=1 Tax=Cupriavidus necator TaxID=106590 RepID=UPI0012D3511C|nr:hypothetical protein [Cupriavidus necator]